MNRAELAAIIAEHLSADELAHLAAARREATHRPRLSTEAANDLAALLTAGDRPALGWWRCHLRQERPTAPAAPMSGAELARLRARPLGLSAEATTPTPAAPGISPTRPIARSLAAGLARASRSAR